MNKDLEILRKNNSELQKKIIKLKEERDKACKDYIDLYNKIEKAKDLIKNLIKQDKYKITTNEFIYTFIDQMGDLKSILDIFEERN